MRYERSLIAGLAAFVLASNVHAITYFGVYGDANAIALTTDGVPELANQSGSPADGPLTASAASVGTSTLATAGAIVGLDLLTTSADVSAGNIGSAVATARFSGAFVNTAFTELALDFTRLDSASGSGAASTTLFVSLVSDGVSLFRDFVEGPWQFSYSPVVGTTSLLDLVLTSDASAAFVATGAGNASAFGLVSVVPEVPTWLLLPLGLAAVVTVRRKTLVGLA